MKDSPLRAAVAGLLLVGPAAAQLPFPESHDFLVSDYQNDRVVAYRPSGALSHTFTAPGLDGPRGIAFLADGRFFVSSELGDEVFAFDRDQRRLFQFGAAELDGPTSIALSPSGDELYVASFQTGRVCVFDLGGAFLRSFTTPGGASPALSTPNCVAFDSAGNIYVSSAATSHVFKFDPGESFLFSFTAPAVPGLSSPMGIAIDGNDCLYVAGGASDNICKFTPDGTFVGELTHPDMSGPQGVAFDQDGHLFTASFFADNELEFTELGAHVQTITAGGLDVPRSVAFAPRRLPKTRTAPGGSLPPRSTNATAAAGSAGIRQAVLRRTLGVGNAIALLTLSRL